MLYKTCNKSITYMLCPGSSKEREYLEYLIEKYGKKKKVSPVALLGNNALKRFLCIKLLVSRRKTGLQGVHF